MKGIQVSYCSIQLCMVVAFITMGCISNRPNVGTLAYLSYATESATISILSLEDFSESYVDGQVSTSCPSWSPDGTRLAYLSRIIDTDFLYLLDVSQNIILKETLLSERGFNLDWSPINDEVVYSATINGPPNLYLLNLENEELFQLTNEGGVDSSPAWSPDGAQIVYSSNLAYIDGDGAGYEDFDLYILDIETGVITRVTDGIFSDHSPRWSPDGQKIAFHSNRNGNDDIFIIDLTTMEIKAITDSPGNDIAPDWSSDGNKLVFASNRDYAEASPLFDIYLIELGTMEVNRITSDGQNACPRWRPGN